MAMIKRGVGQILPDPKDDHTASHWSEEDEAELEQENTEADEDESEQKK